MKSQYWPELKTFLSIFVSWKNPCYLWLYFSRECVFICYLFPLEHETRSVKFFCFVTPKSCVCNNINWEIKSNSARKIRNFSFLINFTSHAIKRRQHSIERDVDLQVVMECLKKIQILYDRRKQIIIEICRLFWNCYLADSRNNALE